MKPGRHVAFFLPWLVLAVVVSAVAGTIWFTNSTLRSVEKNLPSRLLSELADLTVVAEDLAEVAMAAEACRALPDTANLQRLRQQVDVLHASLLRLRESYVFDNMVQASNFHAVVAPATTDLQIWLSEGISGYPPDSEPAMAIIYARISEAAAKARDLSHASRAAAGTILEEQRSRLDRFLYGVNTLFVATLLVTLAMLLLMVREFRSRRREWAHLTALSLAQNSLRESEELYRRLLASIPDAVVRTDLEGTILFANEKVMELSGYRREEVVGRNMFHFVAPEDRQLAIDNTARMVAGPLGPKEYRLLMPDGSSKYFEVNGDLLRTAEGTPYGIVHVCRDITERQRLVSERRRLEERLHRAEKMEAMGTMAGGIAHDLNNVLGVLVGYSELLLLEMAADSPQRQKVAAILKAGQRAAAIIQDLLTLARRGVAVNEVVNLNRVVEETMASLEFQKLAASRPGITFSCRLDERLLNVKGSPVHLGKSLINLLYNAVEAIAGSGHIAIVTENRHLDTPLAGYDRVVPGDYVLVSVEDSGHGIPEKDLRQIFEPFYTKKVMGRSGTGLGLAVVWATARDHGGYIDVVSEEGKGSRFRLYLPATREALPTVDRHTRPEQNLGRGERVLVIDDVVEQRELAASILTRLGYRVEAVASGEAAVATIAAGEEYDLLVLDMIMEPGIDGRETYQRILACRPGQRAIIVSGFSETDNVRRVQALGATTYLRKPYLLETLAEAVRTEIDRPRSPSVAA